MDLLISDNYVLTNFAHRYPVIGTCTEPKPAGPYKVSLSDPFSLAFRNPYKAKTKFEWQFDNTIFELIPASEYFIDSKQVISLY
jgi:hypothetical protein